jgi:hypothetical protein
MVGKLTPDNQLSASIIPIVLNASPYRTRNSLLDEFMRRDKGQTIDHFKAGEAAWWGNHLEHTIGAVAAERLKLTDLQLEFDAAFQHPDLPLAASLDGLANGHGIIEPDPTRGIFVINAPKIDITGPGLLEIKNTSAAPESTPARFRGPLQGQAQLMCHPTAKWLAVCVLYQGTELRIFLYHHDRIIQQQIRDAVLDFERRRTERAWYPWSTLNDAVLCHSTTDGKLPTLQIDPENTEVQIALEHLVHARREIAAHQEDVDNAMVDLMAFMGDHETAIGTVGNERIMLKWPMRQFKAQPQRVVPAKDARSVRQKTLTIKEIDQ